MSVWRRRTSSYGKRTGGDDVKIRPVSPEDLAAVAALEEQSFPSPWRREFFEGELRAPGRYGLVASADDGSLVGYLFAMCLFDEMHINKIAVAESARRKRVASSLMKQCLDYARSSGVREISLEVRASNQGALDFYHYLDFRTAYTRPRYYPNGEAAIVMSLLPNRHDRIEP